MSIYTSDCGNKWDIGVKLNVKKEKKETFSVLSWVTLQKNGCLTPKCSINKLYLSSAPFANQDDLFS